MSSAPGNPNRTCAGASEDCVCEANFTHVGVHTTCILFAEVAWSRAYFCVASSCTRSIHQGFSGRNHNHVWLQVPGLDADYGLDAAQFLSQATGEGKRMTASIERRERRQQQRGKDPLGSQPLLHVVLSKDKGASAAESVNADMLRAGLARVKAGKNQQVGLLHIQNIKAGWGVW